MRFDTDDDEKAMYDAAITAHFTYVGATGIATYLAREDVEYDVAAADQAKSDLLAVQKWISLNGLQEFEGWIETRRFDVPATKVFSDGIFQTPTRTTLGQKEFPTIRLYPQTEVSFNPNTPPGRTILDKVFWDN